MLYIEGVINKRSSTNHEDSLIMSLRYEKPEEFIQITIKYHTECTRESDILSNIHKLGETLAKYQKFKMKKKPNKIKIKRANSLISSFKWEGIKAKDELKQMIKQNNMLEKEMLKLQVEYDSLNRL